MDINRLKLFSKQYLKQFAKSGGPGTPIGKRRHAQRLQFCYGLIPLILGMTHVRVMGPTMRGIRYASGYENSPDSLWRKCWGTAGKKALAGPLRGYVTYTQREHWTVEPNVARLFGLTAYHLLWTQEKMDVLFGEDGLVNVFLLTPDEVIGAIQRLVTEKYGEPQR